MDAEIAGCDAIRGWLSQRCGIHYPENKTDLLRQRLARVQRSFSVATLGDLARRLNDAGQHDLHLAVMHAASTNHTYFFREIEVLNRFRAMILPSLAQRDEIRIWCAACSSGEEAYTLAILIAEALGPMALKRTSILGTDISTPMVQQAEAGIYPETRFQRMPEGLMRKYFTPAGDGQFRVRPELSACCTFRQMNLKTQPYPFKRAFPAVFCRNVLYYFERHDQIATLESIHAVTEPRGWLITSVTENVRDLNTSWYAIDNGMFRKEVM